MKPEFNRKEWIRDIQNKINEYFILFEDIHKNDVEKYIDLEDYLNEEAMTIKVNEGY